MCKKTQFKYCPSKIDDCMKYLIKILNKRGIKTKSCCCGHNKYSMTIVIWDSGLKSNIDIMSMNTIPRKRRFYKKDSEGFYYIPECVKGKEQ